MISINIQQDLFDQERTKVTVNLPFTSFSKMVTTAQWNSQIEQFKVLRTALDLCVEKYIYTRLNAVKHIIRSGAYTISEAKLKCMARIEADLDDLTRVFYLPRRLDLILNKIIPELRHIDPADARANQAYHQRLDQFESVLISLIKKAEDAQLKNDIKAAENAIPEMNT